MAAFWLLLTTILCVLLMCNFAHRNDTSLQKISEDDIVSQPWTKRERGAQFGVSPAEIFAALKEHGEQRKRIGGHNTVFAMAVANKAGRKLISANFNPPKNTPHQIVDVDSEIETNHTGYMFFGDFNGKTGAVAYRLEGTNFNVVIMFSSRPDYWYNMKIYPADFNPYIDARDLASHLYYNARPFKDDFEQSRDEYGVHMSGQIKDDDGDITRLVIWIDSSKFDEDNGYSLVNGCSKFVFRWAASYCWQETYYPDCTKGARAEKECWCWVNIYCWKHSACALPNGQRHTCEQWRL